MRVGKPTKQTPGCQKRPLSWGAQEPQEEEEGKMDPPVLRSCSHAAIHPHGPRARRSL